MALVALVFFLFARMAAFAFSTNEVRTFSGAFTSAFYSQNGTNGYIKDTQTGGVAYFWGQAEMIECVIDAYEWTGDPSYKSMITNLLNGFLQHNGSSWSYNIYNDDILWAVLAFARGGVDTGNPSYCNIAKANFDACFARAWDGVLGGGLYWTSENWTKNACVNGPGAIAAYLLYQIYGDANYLTKANNIYAWERSVLFNANSGAVSDAIGTNGVINYWASTYNQGTFIGAAHFLGHPDDAKLAANFTMMNMTSGGILPEYGIAGNNSGFNAIFLRWLKRFAQDRSLEATYQPWLQLNADAAWNRRRADNLSWCQWKQSSPAGINFFSWDCISSFEILNAATPTSGAAASSVPSGPIGYWPLDETSGSVAIDTSGNGNGGVVSGASWTSGGRFNGCLTFIGANSSVQITNPVCNDFSISFWVKTTQTANTGQWYNGAGLVDGDVPFTGNDFGTALVGGKFAFGIGNPDATILSTTAINNGVWHHCVATRQQAFGTYKVYVDGIVQATGVGSRNSLNAPTRLLLGAISSGNGYFAGSLDDVRIYSRTLSAAEVTALYASSTYAVASAPIGLAATPGNGQVALHWWSAPYATRYNVKRALISGGPYVTIANVSSPEFVDQSTLNNRSYYYVVSAVNAVGESPDSAEISANPTALTVWLRADAFTNLSNGAAVGRWPDMTGNGKDAVQMLMANQPVYQATAMNGRPALRFNAANNSYLWLYRPVQDDFTVVFVFQSSQGIGTGTDFYNGAGLINGEQGGVVNDFGLSLNANGQILAGVGNPDTTIHSGGGYNNGLPHVVTFKRIRSTGTILLYVDGAILPALNGGTQSLTSPNYLTLGGQAVLNNFLTGDIAEVQVYNAAIADADRVAIERSLRCKYGLGGGTTPTAPTGLAVAVGDRRIALNWALVPGATDYSLSRSTDGGASFQVIAANLLTSSYVDRNATSGTINYYKVAANNGCGAGTASAAVGVLLPLPSLEMTVGANALSISWPEWAGNWRLVAATNLTPPVAWVPVTNAAAASNGVFNTMVPIDAGNRFFRLVSP